MKSHDVYLSLPEIGTNTSAGIRGDSLALKDQLTTVLKEYDALRKEVDQSLAFKPEIAKSM